MTTERHIIAGYDGSSAAAAAVRWAAAEAIRRGCPLRVVGCYSTTAAVDAAMPFGAVPITTLDEIRACAEEGLAAVVSELNSSTPDLEVTAVAVSGGARYRLVELAADATLLVVGATGAGEVGSLLLGSVAFAVSRTSPCPVVVVPEQASSESRRNHIVVGVDRSDSSRETLEWAADEADLLGSTLTVVHAWDYPYAAVPPDSQGRDLMQVDAACELDRAVECLRDRSGVDVERLLVEADPADAILAAARDAELVVIGSRGRGSIRALFLGSTSNAVITHAPCPTVIVRHMR